MDRFPRSDSIVQTRTGLQTYMAQVYGWMTVGFLLTAFVAWYAANSAAVMELLFTNRIFLIGLVIAQLALVIVLSAMIQKLSAGVTTMLFMLYSALTGLTLSSIFIVYTAASIASTFVVTAGMVKTHQRLVDGSQQFAIFQRQRPAIALRSHVLA